jgi:hypothetical protein
MKSTAVAEWSFPTEVNHPKKIAAAMEAAVKHSQKIERKYLEEGWAKAHGLQYVHLRGYDIFGKLCSNGGLTIAYVKPKHDYQNVVLISTGLCNPIDSFYKEDGRFYAAREFASGHYIKVRVPGGYGVAEYLMLMFD